MLVAEESQVEGEGGSPGPETPTALSDRRYRCLSPETWMVQSRCVRKNGGQCIETSGSSLVTWPKCAIRSYPIPDTRGVRASVPPSEGHLFRLETLESRSGRAPGPPPERGSGDRGGDSSGREGEEADPINQLTVLPPALQVFDLELVATRAVVLAVPGRLVRSPVLRSYPVVVGERDHAGHAGKGEGDESNRQNGAHGHDAGPACRRQPIARGYSLEDGGSTLGAESPPASRLLSRM